jgi:very-short-patch-repair endonuclease
MPSEAVQARKNLRNLLDYAEEILKAGECVVSDLTRDAIVTFHEHEVAGLEGVSIPKPDQDGGWLRVARLHENAPPEPDIAYLPWLATPARGSGPFDRPRLAPSLLVVVTIDQVSELVEAGLALQDDAMKPKGDRAASRDTVDLLLRLSNLTEFAAGFEAWLEGPWVEWERTERPRRRSIAFYNKLFEIQQRCSSMGDDTPIEAVFGVGLARWASTVGRINAPLIEAAVELELLEDGAIVVQPRPQEPRVMLRPFDELDLPGIGRLQQETSKLLERSYEDPDVGFSPHERPTFEHILRMCHARLASDAVYEPDVREEGDRAPPAADAKLRITDGWLLYVRQRSANFRCDDIRRLGVAVDEAEEGDLPPPALQMTTRPSDAPLDGDLIDLTATALPTRFPDGPIAGAGLAAGSPGNSEGLAPAEDDRAYFFPLPYNDDQIEIVRRLERKDVSGVVVQGPPGTGKTHTIANIVAHYMATGRRVLVSAHQPEALSAIQGLLPESIRDLAISVIHSDREGGRRLERAIDILASQVKLIDRRAYNERRMDLEAELASVRAAIARVDDAIRDHAHLNLTEVAFRAERLIPMELTARVEAERPEHAWFPDPLKTGEHTFPRFGDADIAEAARLRRELGADLPYGASELPDTSSLPDIPGILAAHAALVNERQADKLAAEEELPYVSFGPGADSEEARRLLAWLDAASAWLTDVENSPWLVEAYQLLAGVTSAHETVRNGMAGLCVEWTSLCSDARPFTLRGITLPDAGDHMEILDAAIAALAEGRKPFGAFSFGKSAARAKDLLAAVLVDGAGPKDRDGWSCVRDYRAWQRRARSFLGRWTAAAAAVGFPQIAVAADSPHVEILRLGALVERMQALRAEAGQQTRTLATLFPYGIDAGDIVSYLDVGVVRAALSAALNKQGNADAHDIRRKLSELAAASVRPFHAAVADVAGSLGDSSLPPRDLAVAWRDILTEATRLGSLRSKRERLGEISAAVAASGAPGWAAALLAEIAEEPDRWTPSSWRRTWEWALADGLVRKLSDRGELARITARRAELEDRQRELLGELVRVRTFIGLKQGITERVAAALQKFAVKVRQLGAGTGKAAERHRRGIREATMEAAAAVPCWILPEWRVAEQLPSELAKFDLVIIDEASQSDITSLPAVLRGKKLLVVGDDKQVSPSAVGMEERTVIQLRETFLRGMDIANFLEPTTSLYDLASMTFPGSVVMLREHFRCVEPIIAFSSRFYPKALVPLRVPTAEERLDPPLIDVYLPAGRRVRDVNEAEADYIVAEIARLVALPEYARRSFGVISMVGDKQAKLILDRLVETVGTEAIARHRIMCGNASTFQGQERDVTFLSLVYCPKTVRAQTARLMEQRFNVAMSRARDRMYLVRSVAASMLNQNDLKGAVIEHFRAPMAHSTVPGDKRVLEETESGFEREVGGVLLERGYRLRPQVRVGGYRIDFVVEGEGDRRLAVELDGDRYHGPDRWFEDMRRQRALERLGWTFWRCWGSHWLADRQECLENLVATLSRLGIEPMGGGVGTQVWTEHRVVGDDGGAEQPIRTVAATGLLPLFDKEFTAEKAEPSGVRASTEGEVVEVGDTVIVRFADDNRVRRFRLNPSSHDPDFGEVGHGQPIVQALLGTGIEEEVDLEVGGRQRRVIVEKITKAA